MAQPDPENQQAAREWQSTPALHDEFSSFEAYAAYCSAVASRRARVSQPKTLTVTQNVHTHDKPLSITRPDPGHHLGGVGFPAPDAAVGCLARWSHPVSMDVLNIARGLRANNRTGRGKMEELITAKAGVSLEVAGCARAMAAQEYEKRPL